MESRSVTVQIHHQAGVAAANAVNAKQRGLVDCNAFQGSTFKHRNIPHFLNHEATTAIQVQKPRPEQLSQGTISARVKDVSHNFNNGAPPPRSKRLETSLGPPAIAVALLAHRTATSNSACQSPLMQFVKRAAITTRWNTRCQRSGERSQ